MKKFGIIGLALLFGLSALTGCGAPNGDDSTLSGTDPNTMSEEEAFDPSSEQNRGEYDSPLEKESELPALPSENAPGENAAPVSLALLDTVDVPAAFGTDGAEGWSFLLDAVGDLNARYGISLFSELTGREKFDLEFGTGVGLADSFGVRSEENALGFGLFGGGEASLTLSYRGPHGDSEPLSRRLDVGFRHDGDLVWYTSGGEEQAVSLGRWQELGSAVTAESFARMERAFAVIPEELSKGVSLRLAVEKLIDLGFSVQIDDTDGLAVSHGANAGFYTDLWNDLSEELLPAWLLAILPRVDFRYDRTYFDIRLAFDADGHFTEYTMSSDVALTAALEVRGLFLGESSLALGGGLSFTAHRGEDLGSM